jgi:hypothetical protein
MSIPKTVAPDLPPVHGPAPMDDRTAYLFRAMHRRMPSVALRAWHGTIARTYDPNSPRSQHRVMTTMYKAPVFEALPIDASAQDDGSALAGLHPRLVTRPSQAASVLLAECLAFIAHWGHAKEQTSLSHSLDGEDGGEIGQRYGIHRNAVHHRLNALRTRLKAWAEEVSVAATDSRPRAPGGPGLSTRHAPLLVE